MKPILTIVIPMYNERTEAENCVRQLTGTMEKAAARGGFRYEIIFSDDGSTDGCGEIAERTARGLTLEYGAVRMIRAERNRGKGAATRAGMLAATGNFALFTDCDLAYGTDVIPKMLSDMQKDPTDLLIGSRAIAEDGYAGYTPLRRAASRMYLRLLAAFAGFSHSDSQCGIKLFCSEAARRLFGDCETDGWAFDFEILMRADRMGYAVREYPVRVLRHGGSKIRLLRDSVRMLAELQRIRKRLKKEF